LGFLSSGNRTEGLIIKSYFGLRAQIVASGDLKTFVHGHLNSEQSYADQRSSLASSSSVTFLDSFGGLHFALLNNV
jgi:hypothetical protein